jgi:enoyl-CoA hydratase
MAFVSVEKKDHVAKITIDRPKALNALNAEVLHELRNEFIKLEDASVVVITGAGEKAFVAGADIASMSQMGPMEARAFVEMGQGVMQTLEEAPFISIAAVNGFCLGGGLELALSCDLIYGSAQSKYGAPETNLGIVPGFGGTVNLVARAGFHRAMDLILSGRIIGAEDAKACGLILEIFSAADLMPKVDEIAKNLSKKGRLSMLAARRLVKANAYRERDKALLLERETFATLFASGEPREGMQAFLEKREPKFPNLLKSK